MSVFTDAGLLIIGTRLKRLSDRFLSEVSRIYKSQNIRFEPAWFPIFFLIDKKGTLSLTEIASELEVSHSAISQMITQLLNEKIVEIEQEASDARIKKIVFSAKGKKLIEQVHPVWTALQKSLDQLMPADLSGEHFLKTISQIEEKLTNNSLYETTLSYIDKNTPEVELIQPDEVMKKKLLSWMKNENSGYSYTSGKLLLALQGKTMLGFAVYDILEHSIFLKYLYITPLHRRKGLALQMLQFLKDQVSPAFFNIDNANIDLIKLLIKAGFTFKVN
jgi:DNA-binding MarR family transcriptional regulator